MRKAETGCGGMYGYVWSRRKATMETSGWTDDPTTHQDGSRGAAGEPTLLIQPDRRPDFFRPKRFPRADLILGNGNTPTLHGRLHVRHVTCVQCVAFSTRWDRFRSG